MSKKFHELLKQTRINRGLSQKEVAEKLGVAKSTYSMYESGYREPNLETILKIAGTYGVSTDYLMGLDPEDDLIMNHNLGGTPNILKAYTQEVGEFLYHNPLYKQLFDASMEVSEKDVSLAVEMLNRINGKTLEFDHRKRPAPPRQDDPERKL